MNMRAAVPLSHVRTQGSRSQCHYSYYLVLLPVPVEFILIFWGPIFDFTSPHTCNLLFIGLILNRKSVIFTLGLAFTYSDDVPDPTQATGYISSLSRVRSISLTVLACKFMEHICASHINKFLANTHILNSKQHGFRQGLSCQTQLIEAVNDWVCSLNSKRGAKTCQITVALFDFSKAFDRVCHKRLLLKLDFYGIRGPMREWIDSFLQDRTQTVSIQGVKSSSIHVVSGVPQGSVLGPLLFLLFINDIDNNIQSPLRLFADDTILYREIWSKDDHNIIQNDIQTLFKWSQTWKLDFNVTKCKVLTISNKKDPDKFNYTLNTDPLEHVDSHQYLGVTINSKLRWNTHVSAITAKATRTLNVIRRTLHPCHPEVKKVAYMSLVRPKLEYSSAAWNPHTQNDTSTGKVFFFKSANEP